MGADKTAVCEATALANVADALCRLSRGLWKCLYGAHYYFLFVANNNISRLGSFIAVPIHQTTRTVQHL